MKRIKDLFLYFMLIFVLSFLLVAIYVFVQPGYQEQPSIRNSPSMAMMMLFGHARMHEYSWRPMLEVCDQLCDEMMGGDHTMPQHGNPVLDTANYVLSLLLVVCSAGLVGTVCVLVLLWLPRFKGGKKYQLSMRMRILIYVVLFALTGFLLTSIVFVWLQATVTHDPITLQMDLNFWKYGFFILLILLILVIMFIGAFGHGYDYVKKRLSRFKLYNQKKKGGGKSK